MAAFLTILVNVLTALVALRVALIFFGANVDQPLVGFLVAFTEPFSAPFEGIFAQPSDEAGILPIDLGAVFGIAALQAVGLLVRVVGRRVGEAG